MTDSKKLKKYFIGWQCRIRQLAVRNDDGRPSQGMQATIAIKGTDQLFGPVNTGLVRSDSKDITAEFRFIVQKTHDPNLRQEAAIKLLSSAYYQHPKKFEDFLTATFALDSEIAVHLLRAGKCKLNFEQYQQQFNLHCSVESVEEQDDAYQATYWHNRMFNPVLPAKIQLLKFTPHWGKSTATPQVTK